MNEEITVSEKKKNKRPSTGSTQALNSTFASWIERQFRGGEKPQSIDAYPLLKARDREQRLYHHDIAKDETVSADRAVELSNEIYSDCQIHCDALPRSYLSREGTKSYEVAVIDDRRGGQANPVGTFPLTLSPRIHRPAPTDENGEELSADENEAITARKMMIHAVDGITERGERQQQGVLNVVGETLVLMKSGLQDAFATIKDLVNENRGMMSEVRQLVTQVSQQKVEARAVEIDAENAAVDREYRRAQLEKETMFTGVIQAGMLEGIKILGQLVPGFGQLALAKMSGNPLPPPPQLPASSTPTNGQSTELATVPDERKLVDRFVTAAENYKIGDSTAAEKLFGKDDDEGKQVEAGVFRRDQVNILAGVKEGKLPVEALDALLADSGKPEAVNAEQLNRAMAFVTPAMLLDIGKFMTMRTESRSKNGVSNAR